MLTALKFYFFSFASGQSWRSGETTATRTDFQRISFSFFLCLWLRDDLLWFCSHEGKKKIKACSLKSKAQVLFHFTLTSSNILEVLLGNKASLFRVWTQQVHLLIFKVKFESLFPLFQARIHCQENRNINFAGKNLLAWSC